MSNKVSTTAVPLRAFWRGLTGIDDLDNQVKRSMQELEPLQTELTAIVTNEAQRGQAVGNLVGTESLLKTLSNTIDGPLDWEAKREVVEALVDEISVETSGTNRKKTATLTITYNFSESVKVTENYTSSGAPSPGPGPRIGTATEYLRSLMDVPGTMSTGLEHQGGRRCRSRAAPVCAVHRHKSRRLPCLPCRTQHSESETAVPGPNDLGCGAWFVSLVWVGWACSCLDVIE